MKSFIVFFFAIATTFFATAQPNLGNSSQNDQGAIFNKVIANIDAKNPHLRSNDDRNNPNYTIPTVTRPTHNAGIFTNHIHVPMGTQVVFMTKEKISAARLSDGQMIRLKVHGNVVVDGKTIIRTNTEAIGTIRVNLPISAQSEGEITIEVTSVKNIQGETVQLNSDPNYVTSFIPGTPVDVPLGRMVTASTQNNIEVSLRN